jgi:TetR/AcrR family transcriptional regulator, repressor for uid operon
MPSAEDKLTSRETRRLQTRQRVYEAAIAEFKRTGMAEADVAVIAKEAGVARGTFYFHFPTKEHVLAELERHEEARLAAQFSKFLAAPHPSGGTDDAPRGRAEHPPGEPSLAGALAEVVRLMTTMERRVGKVLFREMLGMHFSPRRPELLPATDQWSKYPMMTLVVEVVERARERGEAYPGADGLRTAQFFMLGLYAVLITSPEHPRSLRKEILDNFLATVLRSVEAR